MAPIPIGIEDKKENLAASTGLYPKILAIVKDVPNRLAPGIKERVCASPIKKASL